MYTSYVTIFVRLFSAMITTGVGVTATAAVAVVVVTPVTSNQHQKPASTTCHSTVPATAVQIAAAGRQLRSCRARRRRNWRFCARWDGGTMMTWRRWPTRKFANTCSWAADPRNSCKTRRSAAMVSKLSRPPPTVLPLALHSAAAATVRRTAKRIVNQRCRVVCPV